MHSAKYCTLKNDFLKLEEEHQKHHLEFCLIESSAGVGFLALISGSPVIGSTLRGIGCWKPIVSLAWHAWNEGWCRYISPNCKDFKIWSYSLLSQVKAEGRRQSKMAANSKSHAVSQTAYARVNSYLYTVWETACGMKGLRQNQCYNQIKMQNNLTS